uniref:Uncharacterized protein n=1 Tax=Mycena chlorophos TaxID=658473 RepID=A0ABQ0M5S6_MYCCL|nr:predicted protein [Mycena chlorophos]
MRAETSLSLSLFPLPLDFFFFNSLARRDSMTTNGVSVLSTTQEGDSFTTTTSTSLPLGVTQTPLTSVITSILLPSSSGSTKNDSASKPSSDGLSSQAIAGFSLGAGILAGAILVLLYVVIQRRRQRRRRQQFARNQDQSRDNEQLIPREFPAAEQAEEKIPFESPPPTPATPQAAHAKVMQWVQDTRNRARTSVASSYLPTIASEPEGAVDLSRGPSVASSKSAYSQASAAYTIRRSEEGGTTRPSAELLRLSRITE